MSDEKHCGCSNGTSKECQAWTTPHGCFCLCHGWSEAAASVSQQDVRSELSAAREAAALRAALERAAAALSATADFVRSHGLGYHGTAIAIDRDADEARNAALAVPARAQGTGMEPGQAVPVEVDPVEAILAVDCPGCGQVKDARCHVYIGKETLRMHCEARIRAAIPATRVGVDPRAMAHELCSRLFGTLPGRCTDEDEPDDIHGMGCDVITSAIRRALSQGTAAARLSPFEHDTTDGSGE